MSRKTSRRNAITTGALTALGIGVVSNGVSAKPSTRMVGVEYDPRSAKVRGEAAGNFNQRTDRLVGTLDLGDDQLKFDQEPTSKIPELDTTKFDMSKGGQYKKKDSKYPNGRELQIHIESIEGADIGGYAEYGVAGQKRAFLLRPTSEGEASEIRDELEKKINSEVKK